jgi:DNA-binding response OmpR family regulator
MKILVVEDQPNELKLAHQVLAAAGHSVSEAGTADQAFAAIKLDRPQLILLDLMLPGMDGLTLARKLKGDPATSGIPVVAVTSFPEEYSKTAALAAGCDAFFAKPINTRDLSLRLVAVLRQQTPAKDDNP